MWGTESPSCNAPVALGTAPLVTVLAAHYLPHCRDLLPELGQSIFDPPIVWKVLQ